ncbi:MAG: DNA mismatch endonuclease Vsr [Kiritimatiellae bacterium]|nr:DNA mismatch endonuclease Vsr [Kiritimatiellia bacterium]
MTDTLSRERRSWTMSRIRSRDTKPELVVRRFLFAHGLRFRVNVARLPGHPDIVLRKFNAIVEVRGCFWHRHSGCKVATTPKSHVRFWKEKFRRNVERDRLHESMWAESGWRVFVVWECELRPSVRAATLDRLYSGITASSEVAFSYGAADGGELPAAAEGPGGVYVTAEK